MIKHKRLMKTENIVRQKAFQFSIRIIRLYQYLQKRKEFVISKQVLRSGTSIGANLEEAQGSSSRRDFTAKMTTVYKEARETRYWLMLLRESKLLTQKETASILNDCEELLKIIGSIIKTIKEKQVTKLIKN